MLRSTQPNRFVARMDRQRPAVRLGLAPIPRLTQPLKRPVHLLRAADPTYEKGQDDDLRYPLAGVRLL